MEIRPLRSFSVAFLAMLVLSGCDEKPERIEITQKRKLQSFEQEPVIHATSAQRFSLDEMVRLGKTRFVIPVGWRDAGPDRMRMRLVNLSFGVGAEAECYVSQASGTVEANVNRWRGQMGLAALSADEVFALPRQSLMEKSAIRLDIEGDFKGMGPQTPVKAGFRMIGLILEQGENKSTFVKLTGPKEVVAEHEARFKEFCDSLKIL
ncbi:MAG: hypothetical protein ACI8UO_003027 [Verrucomicrobiales bacterium]|jgi:hypothetical protein